MSSALKICTSTPCCRAGIRGGQRVCKLDQLKIYATLYASRTTQADKAVCRIRSGSRIVDRMTGGNHARCHRRSWRLFASAACTTSRQTPSPPAASSSSWIPPRFPPPAILQILSTILFHHPLTIPTALCMYTLTTLV